MCPCLVSGEVWPGSAAPTACADAVGTAGSVGEEEEVEVTVLVFVVVPLSLVPHKL